MTFLILFPYLFCTGFISNMSTHRQYFPDEEDETGAAKALMRLQDTYQLDSEAFSRGKLPGTDKCSGPNLFDPADWAASFISVTAIIFARVSLPI